MKHFLIFTIILIISCKSYEIVQIDQSKLDSKPINSNIALIGFFPYKFEKNGNIITASLDYDNSLKEYFISGKPIDNYKSRDLNSLITNENCNVVIQKYLEEVRISGLKELEDVLFIKSNKGKNIDCLMKSDNVDYYIFGVLGEPFPQDMVFWAQNLGNDFLSFITLGINPSYSRRPLRVNYYIYDSKFNPINDIHYEKYILIKKSWWFNLETSDDEKYTRDEQIAIKKSLIGIIQEFHFDYANKLK